MQDGLTTAAVDWHLGILARGSGGFRAGRPRGRGCTSVFLSRRVIAGNQDVAPTQRQKAG